MRALEDPEVAEARDVGEGGAEQVLGRAVDAVGAARRRRGGRRQQGVGRAGRALVQNTVTGIFNAVFLHQGIDRGVKVGFPFLHIIRVRPFMLWPAGNCFVVEVRWPMIAIRITELNWECRMKASVPGRPVESLTFF